MQCMYITSGGIFEQNFEVDIFNRPTEHSCKRRKVWKKEFKRQEKLANADNDAKRERGETPTQRQLKLDKAELIYRPSV